MTLFGVAIGISTFVSLTTISHSFKSQISGMIKSYSIDLCVMAKGAANPAYSRISLSDYHKLGETEGVQGISSFVLGSMKSAWNPYFIVIGVSSIETLATRLGMVEGRLFIPGKREVVLGELSARRLNLRIGDKVLPREGEEFSVSGIHVTGSKLLDGAGIFDIRDAQRMLNRDDCVNMAFIQVREGKSPDEILEKINQNFPELSATHSGNLIGQIRLIKVVETSARTISIISFIACCIIVMNTFMMAVTERTKEIGILRAVGWSQWMVARNIVFEAMGICLLGGILGNLVGLVQLWIFSEINPEGLGWWIPLSSSADILVKSIGLSLLLGIVGSLYPALQASKLLPAEALRYE